MSVRIAKTDTEILSSVYPEPEWIVPKYLPEGYTLIAGLPKLGKSVIGLQIAEAVSAGGMLFGQRIKQGNVLYIGVEDTERRLHRRMKQNGHIGTGNIYFYTEWDPLDINGAELLREELLKREYRVCILDTLFRLLSPKARQNDSGDMVKVGDILSKLSKPGDGYVNSIIALDHHNKGAFYDENSDAIVNVSGSISKTGAADAVWGCYRKRGNSTMKVQIEGRDVDESMIELQYDTLTACYQYQGDIKQGSVQDKIYDYLRENMPTTVTNIAIALSMQVPNVSREMGELIAKGKVVKIGKEGRAVNYITVEEGITPLSYIK